MKNEFKIVIDSKHRFFDLHIKETWKYRDLVKLFVRRNFTSQYKQTLLGPLWALIQPLLTTTVFTIVFGSLAKLTTMDIQGDYALPGFLFYMIGTICWSYFSSTLVGTSNTFIANSGTMGKVYYPRLVVPLSTAFTNLISFGIQFLMFAVTWIVYVIIGGTSIQVTPRLLLIPLEILQMMILAIGCGIIISSVTTKYRDMAMLVGFGLQLWQYATPVAYGLTLIPEEYMGVYLLNPMTPIITTFRYAVFGFGYFNWTYYLIGWGISLALFFIGLVLFSKIERTFIDTI